MADFGGLASVLQMQNQGLLNQQAKQTKQQARKRSLDPNGDDPNARVNSKLLQLLKENQDDFGIINGNEQQQQQQQQQLDLLNNLDQHGYGGYESENYVIE